jgi:hypothetical protein
MAVEKNQNAREGIETERTPILASVLYPLIVEKTKMPARALRPHEQNSGDELPPRWKKPTRSAEAWRRGAGAARERSARRHPHHADDVVRLQSHRRLVAQPGNRRVGLLGRLEWGQCFRSSMLGNLPNMLLGHYLSWFGDAQSAQACADCASYGGNSECQACAAAIAKKVLDVEGLGVGAGYVQCTIPMHCTGRIAPRPADNFLSVMVTAIGPLGITRIISVG